jgi:UMF1 family MFS transporter
MLNEFFKDVDKKQAISWAFYDFANSSYFLIVISFIFSIYFKEVIAPSNGDFWWGFAVSVSIFLGGVTTPLVGAISDKYQKKKNKLVLFTTIAIIGTFLLYFSGPNLFVFSMLVFMATNFCVEVSQTIYDSFLNQISTKETKGRISGLGYAFGYLGGIFSMIILKPIYESQSTHNLTFPLTAMIFLLFSLPLFIFIKEKTKAMPQESFLKKTEAGLQFCF